MVPARLGGEVQLPIIESLPHCLGNEEPIGHFFGDDAMEVGQTFNSDRREQATDSRGLPKSYARAITALEGPCAHCSQRAIVANGAGVGLCATHRRMHVDAIAQRHRARREIEALRRG